jgi:hypothetical protein
MLRILEMDRVSIALHVLQRLARAEQGLALSVERRLRLELLCARRIVGGRAERVERSMPV